MATVNSGTAKINYIEYVQDTLKMRLGWKSESLVLHNLAGFAVDMQIRKLQADATPLYSFSSADGTIQLNVDEKCNIQIPISDTITAALGAGEFHYFIRTTDTVGFVNTLVSGKLTLRLR
jgi:hypothetical protein